jgi:hypothetical protein
MYTLRLHNLQYESKLPNEPNWIDRRKLVIPVTKAAWLRMGQPALVNAGGIRRPSGPMGLLREP